MRIKDLLLPSNVVQYRTPIIDARSFVNVNTSASNWTITLPRVPVEGRLMLVFISVIQSRTPILAGGWTQVTLAGIVGAKTHVMAWKVAGPNEPDVAISYSGNLSHGVACYYEIDNVDTTGTFYNVVSSANQDSSGPYTTASSNVFSVDKPTAVFTSAVFIGGTSTWTADSGFASQSSNLGGTAHLVYTQNVVNSVVTWSKPAGGSTSSTKVSVVSIFGKANTTNSLEYNNPNQPKLVNKGTPVFRVNSGALAVPYPANIVAGNMLIMACISRGGNLTTGAVTSPPSGYTFLGYQYGSGANYTAITIYYKIATGSETGTEAMSINTGTNYAAGGQIYQFTASTISSWTAPTSADISGTITQPAINGTRKDLVVIFTTTAANVVNAGNWSGISGGINLNAEALATSTTSTGLGLTWQLNLGTPEGNLTGSCAMSGAVALSAGFKLAA